MPLKLANTGQKLPPLPLVSLVLFRKMTVIQMFDRFVIQSEYAVDACHSSSMKGSRPPRKQPSRGAGSISGCPFRGCQENYRVVGCKFVKLIFTLSFTQCCSSSMQFNILPFLAWRVTIWLYKDPPLHL